MVCEGVGYEVSWSHYGSCQLCIWSYEVLNVDIKNFIKELLRKRTLIIAKVIPWIPESAFLSSISFYFRLSLVEYFCTQGSLTLVAGEAQEQICFGSCCMTVVQCDDDKEMRGPWAGQSICVFVLCYNATPLPCFVMICSDTILWQNFLNYRAHMHLSLSNDLWHLCICSW